MDEQGKIKIIKKTIIIVKRGVIIAKKKIIIVIGVTVEGQTTLQDRKRGESAPIEINN